MTSLPVMFVLVFSTWLSLIQKMLCMYTLQYVPLYLSMWSLSFPFLFPILFSQFSHNFVSKVPELASQLIQHVALCFFLFLLFSLSLSLSLSLSALLLQILYDLGLETPSIVAAVRIATAKGRKEGEQRKKETGNSAEGMILPAGLVWSLMAAATLYVPTIFLASMKFKTRIKSKSDTTQLCHSTYLKILTVMAITACLSPRLRKSCILLFHGAYLCS